MARVVISPEAVAEIQDIWFYIALDSGAAADRVRAAIDHRIRPLAEFPLMGPERDDIGQGVRMLVEGRYLILYAYDEARDLVEVVSVVDGARNLP